MHTYKIGDPILFNETNRFWAAIYNNLKWYIVGINLFDDRVQFDIKINKILTELDILDFELLDSESSNTSIIRFFVYKENNTDEDEDVFDNSIVPFQIAYAISIHKAQGLEYNSVKIVITDEIEEMITHNIFYTAITRAKENLKIYRSPETESKILMSLEKRDTKKDSYILKNKFDI